MTALQSAAQRMATGELTSADLSMAGIPRHLIEDVENAAKKIARHHRCRRSRSGSRMNMGKQR